MLSCLSLFAQEFHYRKSFLSQQTFYFTVILFNSAGAQMAKYLLIIWTLRGMTGKKSFNWMIKVYKDRTEMFRETKWTKGFFATFTSGVGLFTISEHFLLKDI